MMMVYLLRHRCCNGDADEELSLNIDAIMQAVDMIQERYCFFKLCLAVSYC